MNSILKITFWAIGLIISLVLLTTAGLYLTNSGNYMVHATTEVDSDLPVVEADGYRFHGEIIGSPDSPLIIALHGGPGGDYRSLLDLKELQNEYQILFYDQRGSGLSPRVNESELTVDQYINDLKALADKYRGDDQIILIGHSWGAMLASVFIGQYPEIVSKAVLAEPGFLDHQHMEIFYERTGLNNLIPSVSLLSVIATAFGESLHINHPDDHARQDYVMNRIMSTPIDDHPIGGYYRDGKLENAVFKYWRFGSAAAAAIPESGIDSEGKLIDLAAGVDKWKGEALFLAGSENSIIGPEYQQEQMKRFPSATLRIIRGAGHTMLSEKPKESLSAIRSFLKTNNLVVINK